MVKILGNKKRQKTVEKRVVGAYLPHSLIQFITLYALSKGMSISNLVEKVLLDLKMDLNYEEEEMLISIGKTCTETWRKEKQKTSKYTLSSFLGDLERELKSKKIEKSHIETILKIVKDEAKA